MSVASLAQAKRQVTIDADDDSADDDLQMWLDASTAAMEKARGEVIDQKTMTDEFQLGGATSVVLRSTPVISLTSVATTDGATTWDTANLHVNAGTGTVTVKSGTPPLNGQVAFVYTAGYTSPAANYQAAELIIFQHLWETRRGTMGVPRGGEDEMYIPQLGYAIPRRAAELLGLSIPGIA